MKTPLLSGIRKIAFGWNVGFGALDNKNLSSDAIRLLQKHAPNDKNVWDEVDWMEALMAYENEHPGTKFSDKDYSHLTEFKLPQKPAIVKRASAIPLLNGIRKEALNLKALGPLAGAGIGGITGALIDKNKRWRGALIGAGLGGLAGYGIGRKITPDKSKALSKKTLDDMGIDTINLDTINLDTINLG